VALEPQPPHRTRPPATARKSSSSCPSQHDFDLTMPRAYVWDCQPLPYDFREGVGVANLECLPAPLILDLPTPCQW